MCTRGLREDAVSRPTGSVRQAPAAAALSEDRIGSSHRAALLRPARWQDAHRNADQGHATQWRLLQLALHAHAIAKLYPTLKFGLRNHRVYSTQGLYFQPYF